MQNAASLKFKEPLILRAKFSAVTKKDIQHAMETLVAPNIHVRVSIILPAFTYPIYKTGVLGCRCSSGIGSQSRRRLFPIPNAIFSRTIWRFGLKFSILRPLSDTNVGLLRRSIRSSKKLVLVRTECKALCDSVNPLRFNNFNQSPFGPSKLTSQKITKQSSWTGIEGIYSIMRYEIDSSRYLQL